MDLDNACQIAEHACLSSSWHNAEREALIIIYKAYLDQRWILDGLRK